MEQQRHNPGRRAWLTQALSLLSVAAAPSLAFAQNTAHIVIVGGGVGGATAAKYLKLFNPALKVTLIEKNPATSAPTVRAKCSTST
jgi:sulfide dehydrogenase [flavocytochrome c] flavoprotein chain